MEGPQIPKQVDAAVQAADALYQQVYGSPSPENPDAPQVEEATKPGDAPGEQSQVAADAAKPADQIGDGDKVAATPDIAELERDRQYWKDRAEVMIGKYNAEVPKLLDRVKTLEAQLGAQNGGGPAQAAAPVAGTTMGVLDPAKYAEFGEEIQSLAVLVNTVVAENTALKRDVQGVGAKVAASAQDQFWAEVKKGCPDLAAFGKSEQFIRWCQSINRRTGKENQFDLDEALHFLDHARFVAVLDAWKQESAYGKGNAQAPTHTELLSREEKPTLEDQLSPTNRPGMAGEAKGSAGRIWTQAEIRHHGNDVIRGAFRGREAEADAIDRDIHLASAEGRVRG